MNEMDYNTSLIPKTLYPGDTEMYPFEGWVGPQR
jgi:hypothetical protein